jgi:hypothetical protein
MATAIADFQATSSRSVVSRVGIDNAIEGRDYIRIDYIRIHADVEISIFQPGATARVIQPFYVEVIPTEDGYMASSGISNAFELGKTAGQALRNYLEFLVDELIWLQKNVKQLSPSIQEDLHLLQRFLRIV